MTAAKPDPQKAAARKRAAATVRAAEATDGYLDVEHCGVSLRIPVGGKVPLAAFIKFEAGDEIGGTEILLGPEQWEQFMAANPTIDDFNEIGSKIEAIAGN